jgi:hypothetical protein
MYSPLTLKVAGGGSGMVVGGEGGTRGLWGVGAHWGGGLLSSVAGGGGVRGGGKVRRRSRVRKLVVKLVAPKNNQWRKKG